MPFKVVSQKGFLQGLKASTDRFNIATGGIQRSSNLLLGHRGALTVCNGTGVIATDPTGTNPGTEIVEVGIYVNPNTFAITPIMGTTYPGGPLDMYSFSLQPVSGFTFLSGLTLTNGWIMPQFISFAGVTVISLGNDAPLVQYDPAGYTGVPTTNGFANLAYNNRGPGGAAAWQANTFYTVGQRIAAPDGNNVNSTWQVVNVVVGSTSISGASSTMSNSSGVGGGGMSGASEPNFANSASAVKGTGETVTDNQIIWMCLKEHTSLAQQYPPHGAAHIIKHASALWAWNTAPATTVGASGTVDGPSVVRMSDPNNANSWPLVNTEFVGRDDGTQGTGIATFTIAEAGITPEAQLVLFKDYSTYAVTGVFQAQDFAIKQVKTDMGCLAPRSVQFATGFGVIRFCHLGFALYTGTVDGLVSEDIRPYIFGDASPTPAVDFTRLNQGHSALTTNPPLYTCCLPTTDGNTTRIFCYDLVQKAWMIVDYMNANGAYPITAMEQLRPPYNSGYGVQTVIADFGPGNVASIRRWQGGDAAWDATNPPTPVAWSFRPPEVGEPGSRAYFRRANVRLTAPQPGQITGFFNIGEESQPNNIQQVGGAGPSSGTAPNIATTANYNGNEDLGVALDVHETGPSLNGTYSGSGPANIEGVDYHINAKTPRPFGQRF
jgi:hypothetical protein